MKAQEPGQGGLPYYIVAPRYDPTSAGNRVLYTLCHTLNERGRQAWIVAPSAVEDTHDAERERLRAPVLTAAMAEAHAAGHDRSIWVYPETTAVIPERDLAVVYLLNYPGLLGGSSQLPEHAFIVAYAENVARRAPRCDGVLFIPVSDPEYWTPDPEARRIGPAVYAGKYVDHHGQPIPLELQHARRITRHRPDSPTRAQLREVFRAATRLYVFENTALATEAALCGCPVVYRTNPWFPELIAARELGLDGFAPDDSPVEIARAERTVGRFRAAYLRARAQFDPALDAFIAATQVRAALRI